MGLEAARLPVPPESLVEIRFLEPAPLGRTFALAAAAADSVALRQGRRVVVAVAVVALPPLALWAATPTWLVAGRRAQRRPRALPVRVGRGVLKLLAETLSTVVAVVREVRVRAGQHQASTEEALSMVPAEAVPVADYPRARQGGQVEPEARQHATRQAAEQQEVPPARLEARARQAALRSCAARLAEEEER